MTTTKEKRTGGNRSFTFASPNKENEMSETTLAEAPITDQVSLVRFDGLKVPSWTEGDSETSVRTADRALNITFTGSTASVPVFNDGDDRVESIQLIPLQDYFIRADGILEVHKPVIALYTEEGGHLTTEQARFLASELIRAAEILEAN